MYIYVCLYFGTNVCISKLAWMHVWTMCTCAHGVRMWVSEWKRMLLYGKDVRVWFLCMIQSVRFRTCLDLVGCSYGLVIGSTASLMFLVTATLTSLLTLLLSCCFFSCLRKETVVLADDDHRYALPTTDMTKDCVMVSRNSAYADMRHTRPWTSTHEDSVYDLIAEWRSCEGRMSVDGW